MSTPSAPSLDLDVLGIMHIPDEPVPLHAVITGLRSGACVDLQFVVRDALIGGEVDRIDHGRRCPGELAPLGFDLKWRPALASPRAAEFDPVAIGDDGEVFAHDAAPVTLGAAGFLDHAAGVIGAKHVDRVALIVVTTLAQCCSDTPRRSLRFRPWRPAQPNSTRSRARRPRPSRLSHPRRPTRPTPPDRASLPPW